MSNESWFMLKEALECRVVRVGYVILWIVSNSVVCGGGTVDMYCVDGQKPLVIGVWEVVVGGKEKVVAVES